MARTVANIHIQKNIFLSNITERNHFKIKTKCETHGYKTFEENVREKLLDIRLYDDRFGNHIQNAGKSENTSNQKAYAKHRNQ